MKLLPAIAEHAPSIAANGEMYDPAQAEEYVAMLYRYVDWQPGQIMSLLGIGEKGTAQEGVFRERQLVSPGFPGAIHAHLKRWAQHHVAGFIVPAVLHAEAHEGKAGGALDKVAALTAIILDIDSGDVTAKAKYATDRLGQPTMVVASGGKTDAGKFKAHLYWLLSEPSEEIERVAALRKLLAQKVGGDASFGRATQVVRVPGSVHAKNGNASLCRILERSQRDYDLDELADIIEGMERMPGLPAPTETASLPSLSLAGGMDFTPRQDTALAALHRDINEGGEDLTRWSEFSKVAGFHIAEIRAGRLTPDAAWSALGGWVLTHMNPPWPQSRIDSEFRALVNVDIASHGPFPPSVVPWSNVSREAALPIEHFADLEVSLSNAWLVRDFIALAGLAAIYGSPGTGKSFLALDISLRIAAGWPVDGRDVATSPVIYVVAEGQRGQRNRAIAFRQHHNIEGELPFAMIPCAVNLLDPNADLPRLIEVIEGALARLGGKPGLIVIDTLAATFGGGDENGPAMSGYVNNMGKLRDHFGATIMVVHHRPKDQLNDTLRGHGSLLGGLDTVIRVDGDATRLATTTKQKDGEAGERIAFGLDSITLGHDEKGQPVKSAVVKYLIVDATKKLSPGPAAILQALSDAIEASGAPAVAEAVWRAKWEVCPTVVDKTDEARRKSWMRGRDSLRNLGRVEVKNGLWAIGALPPATQSMDFSVGASS